MVEFSSFGDHYIQNLELLRSYIVSLFAVSIFIWFWYSLFPYVNQTILEILLLIHVL